LNGSDRSPSDLLPGNFVTHSGPLSSLRELAVVALAIVALPGVLASSVRPLWVEYATHSPASPPLLVGATQRSAPAQTVAASKPSVAFRMGDSILSIHNGAALFLAQLGVDTNRAIGGAEGLPLER